MGKTVILAKNATTGLRKAFRTTDEAAPVLGVSAASVSAASIDMRETGGWVIRRVERVFAVHTRVHNEWLVATVNSKGMFSEYGNPERKISGREIDEVRDITAGWYMQDEIVLTKKREEK